MAGNGLHSHSCSEFTFMILLLFMMSCYWVKNKNIATVLDAIICLHLYSKGHSLQDSNSLINIHNVPLS